MEEKINLVVSDIINLFIQPIAYLLIFLATIYFFWGMAIYILNSDNETERQKGKKHMIFGIIGLLIIFAVNGLISIINSSLLQVLK